MAGRSDQRRRSVDEPEGTTAEDAEAEERATDEGMPEHPGGATSEVAARTDRGPGPGPIAPPDAGPLARSTVDDDEEDDGGYDLGGEA